MENILYADIEFGSDDYFVITPEGNYFNFPYPEYNEMTQKIIITDPKSHKNYVVVFDE